MHILLDFLDDIDSRPKKKKKSRNLIFDVFSYLICHEEITGGIYASFVRQCALVLY